MNYDQVLDHVGQFGLWQILVCALASLAAMAEAFMTLQYTFVGYSDFAHFRCLVDICETKSTAQFNASFLAFTVPNASDEEDRACLMHPPISPKGLCEPGNFDREKTVACQAHVFSPEMPYAHSLVETLDLPPCKQAGNDWPLKAAVSQMAFINMGYMFGLLIGSFVFGLVSDKFGRKKALLLSGLLSGAFSLGGSFVSSYWVYFILRLCLGICSKGLFMLAFMVCVEISGVKYKTYLGVLIQVPFAVAEMLVGLVAYYEQEWQTLQQIMSGLVLGMLLLWYFMPESPRWLLSKNKHVQAISVLTNGAMLNRNPLPEGFLRYSDGATYDNDHQTEKLGLISLFNQGLMAKITLVMFLNWLTATMSYYGLSLISVNLTGDIYVNFVLSAVIEIPSYIFCVLVMDHIGRRTLLIFCQILAGSTCIIAGVLNSDLTAAITALTLAGKFGASASFAIVYLYTAELYPTVIRNSAVGSASMIARIGGIAAPLLAGLPGSTPLIIMGGSSLLGGLLALLLPETLGAKLPESIAQVVDLYNSGKPWYKWMSSAELAEATRTIRSPPRTPMNSESQPAANNAASPKLKAKPKPFFVVPDIVIDPATPTSAPKVPKVAIIPDEEKAPPAIVAASEEVPEMPETEEIKEEQLDTDAVDSSEQKSQPNLGLAPKASEKSRRFSQLPPASTDSPNAVKLGSKFTMIPRENGNNQ